jgi:NADH-quinone oxidoreductase subunit H
MNLGDPASIAQWLREILMSWGLADGVISVLLNLLGVVVMGSVILVTAILLVWVERKISARIQDRVGPNRVGPYGLFQPVADIIKLIIKEDLTPEGADKTVYNIAPILAMASVLLLWAVIPVTSSIIGTDVNIGVLYIVAIGGLGTLAILMAGWSSNNKYALLGAFRTVAQLVSYEVPLVLVLLVPVILARTMGMNGIVESQGIWFVLFSPLAALIFFIASLAEVGRTPFDLLEAESEIVAGFHIEYSGMKFGLFLASELIHAFTISALTATLFFGGWRGPGVESAPVLGILYFLIKTALIYFVVMWIRGTLPRVRIDHMMAFNWKFLTPLSLILLIATAVVDKLVTGYEPLARMGAHLAINVVLIWLTIQTLRYLASESRQRLAVGEPLPVARAPEPIAVASEAGGAASEPAAPATS